MIEKDQSPTTSRTRNRWRFRTSCSTPHRSTKSQLSQADARSDCELLPYHFPKHFGENFYITRLHLANYPPTLWFQATGAQFIDFYDIHLAANERPEGLYQRLMAFVEDSLLHANGLTHHGEHVPEDEELIPTLENFVVLSWLRLLPLSLPRLVKEHYSTELRSHTLTSST